MLKAILLIALGIACLFDVRTRRIPNALVALILVISLVGASTGQSSAPSLAAAAAGLTTGLAIALPLWLVSRIGAGDVKLLAAGASWIGMSLAWRAAVLAAVLGGLWSITVILNGILKNDSQSRRRGLQALGALTATQDGNTLKALELPTVPYAVPISIGLAVAIIAPVAFGTL